MYKSFGHAVVVATASNVSSTLPFIIIIAGGFEEKLSLRVVAHPGWVALGSYPTFADTPVYARHGPWALLTVIGAQKAA